MAFANHDSMARAIANVVKGNASPSPTALPRRLHRRQEQPHEHANDRDHNEQFHQRKSKTAPRWAHSVRVSIQLGEIASLVHIHGRPARVLSGVCRRRTPVYQDRPSSSIPAIESLYQSRSLAEVYRPQSRRTVAVASGLWNKSADRRNDRIFHECPSRQMSSMTFSTERQDGHSQCQKGKTGGLGYYLRGIKIHPDVVDCFAHAGVEDKIDRV